VVLRDRGWGGSPQQVNLFEHELGFATEPQRPYRIGRAMAFRKMPFPAGLGKMKAGAYTL